MHAAQHVAHATLAKLLGSRRIAELGRGIEQMFHDGPTKNVLRDLVPSWAGDKRQCGRYKRDVDL